MKYVNLNFGKYFVNSNLRSCDLDDLTLNEL